MHPAILALDTSTELSALALLWAGGRLTRVLPGGSAASARLIPDALELLANAGLSLADLDAIAVSIGPGAFTGLRTACAVAQGFAFALDRPVLRVDSLMQVAEGVLGTQPPASPLWVAMDARMQEVYAAAYELVDGQWCVLEAPALYTLDALAARWQAQPPACVAGSAIEAFGDALPCEAARRLAPVHDRAEALASLVRRTWGVSGLVGATEVLPVYLRDKVALTMDERARAAALRSGA